MEGGWTGVPLSGTPLREVRVVLDPSVYSERVVLRAIHSLAPKLTGTMSVAPSGALIVELHTLDREFVSAEAQRGRLMIALGDFVLRERLEAETRATRELVVRQAFERTNLQWPELDLVSPGEDPLRLGNPDPETGRSHGP